MDLDEEEKQPSTRGGGDDHNNDDDADDTQQHQSSSRYNKQQRASTDSPTFNNGDDDDAPTIMTRSSKSAAADDTNSSTTSPRHINGNGDRDPHQPRNSSSIHIRTHRPALGFYISQSRFKFSKPVDFNDVEPGEKSIEYRRQKIPGYTEEKRTLEMGFQAAPRSTEIATQTQWMNSVNKATQYTAVNFYEEEKEAIMQSVGLRNFILDAESLILRELQMNETLDIFKDEFREFEDEEVSLGNRLENNLEVFHSFSHFKYSKNKMINGVQWFPNALAQTSHLGGAAGNQQGNNAAKISSLGGSGTLVGFSCSNNVTFDQWVEQSGKVLTSSILIYSLQDVLHPYLILEVPGNIQCFKVHPQHPEYIIGGLMTGQVIFWDLTDAREKVRMYQEQQKVNMHTAQRAAGGVAGGVTTAAVTSSSTATTTQSSKLPSSSTNAAAAPAAGGSTSDEHDAQDEISIPPIKYTVLSYIDRSHSRPVSDLVWLPATQQVNRRGEYYTGERNVSSQFASVASDGRILFWDFKNRNDGSGSKYAAQAAQAAMGPTSSLAQKVASQSSASGSGGGADAADPDAKEPKWAPIYSLPLIRNDVQNANNASGAGGVGVATGGATGGPTTTSSSASSSSVGAIKLALGEGTVMMAVTENGEVVEIDWGARATEDRAKPDTVKHLQRAHFSAATAVERSPHFPDIYLTVGDWTFSIWKVGVEQPVFTSACANEYLTCGRWSPTRPGIIVMAKSDGTIDVWDLVDQCHKASLNFQTGFADALSSLEFWQSKNSSQQYLAAGDSGGKLHIIEIPRNLRRKIANEENLMRLFYEREIARANYCKRRQELRKLRMNNGTLGGGMSSAAQAIKSKQVHLLTDEAQQQATPQTGIITTSILSNGGTTTQNEGGGGSAGGADRDRAARVRQLEDDASEKVYQKLFDQFKATLEPEEMRQETHTHTQQFVGKR